VIEAEYKARLSDADTVRAGLRLLAEPECVSYQDAYYDNGNGDLDESGCELRLRTIEGAHGQRRHLITFKDAAVDDATGSKPEHETVVEDRGVMEEIVSRLGYRPIVSFTKRCQNFRFMAAGREMLATLVEVPEIDGTFLELETQVEEADMTEAFDDLRSVLADLNVSPSALTTELYTDAVMRARQV
jgi:adenylate cyclase class 2